MRGDGDIGIYPRLSKRKQSRFYEEIYIENLKEGETMTIEGVILAMELPILIFLYIMLRK